MVIRRTVRRAAPRRRALAPRRRSVHSVLSGSIVLAGGEIDAFDLMGVVVSDIPGLTHVATWGQVTILPTVTPLASAVPQRAALACRLDTTAVANLASAALLPLRDFTAAGGQVADKAWRQRRYYHSRYIAGGGSPDVGIGTREATASTVYNYRVTRLGTLDAGEGWYLYARNSDAALGKTIFLDLQTVYLLA